MSSFTLFYDVHSCNDYIYLSDNTEFLTGDGKDL